MKFGINFFPAFRPSQATAAEYFAQCLRVSERADALGYSSIKTVEHYFNDYGGSCPNPIVLLSAIAARTRRVRPITGAVIPAFNHPIKLAGELAMLDNISGGRLDVGVGRAFVPAEYAAYGLDMAESRARFEEGTDAMVRLWTEERVTYQGRFWHFEDVHLAPRPFQAPHPPIWRSGSVRRARAVPPGDIWWSQRRRRAPNRGPVRPVRHAGFFQLMPAEGRQLSAVLTDITRQVLNELADLPADVLNQDVGLPEANTLFALATHVVGAAEFWVLSLAGGYPLDRGRAAEFVASGTYDDLERRYSAWLLAVDELLSPRSSDELDQRVELPSDQKDTLGGQEPTVRACVLHAIEHSALHLGHIQMTQTLLAGVNK